MPHILCCAGIVLHKVMTDRRHVLTRDSGGCVALWDVLSGGMVESYGQVRHEVVYITDTH